MGHTARQKNEYMHSILVILARNKVLIKLKKTMKQWRTELEIVDIETGVILTKDQIDRQEYLIINKEKRNEYENEKYNIRKITWCCKKNTQQKLDL